MKFHNLFRQLILPEIEHPLSRLYGYMRTDNGQYEIVNDESQIISKVINTLADSTDSFDSTLNQLLIELDNTRNRAGQRWRKKNLLSLCKIIYAGMVKNNHGRLVQSTYYKPIVSVEKCKKAIAKAKVYQNSDENTP